MLKTLVLVTDILFSSTSAFAQVPFYQGKTMTIIHGRSAGGSGDFANARVGAVSAKVHPGQSDHCARIYGRWCGRKAANHIFNVACPDGLTIGSVGGAVVESAVLGEVGVQYDLDKLHFVGSPYSVTHYVLMTRREAGFQTLDKLQQASGVRFGAQSVGHTAHTIGRIMAWLLGLKEIKEVTGFSNSERRAALLRGEIDGYATTDDFLARDADWLDKGLIDLHVIVAVPREDKHPFLFAGARRLRQNRAGAQANDHVPQFQIDGRAV